MFGRLPRGVTRAHRRPTRQASGGREFDAHPCRPGACADPWHAPIVGSGFSEYNSGCLRERRTRLPAMAVSTVQVEDVALKIYTFSFNMGAPTPPRTPLGLLRARAAPAPPPSAIFAQMTDPYG
eukprot:COSAG05_NODE_1530_length_4621_cov_3.869084_1_plen_124_part_00